MKYSSKLILVIVVILLMISYAGFLVYRNYFTFYLTGTSPRTGSISYLTPYIDISFSQDINTDFNDFGIISEDSIVTTTSTNKRTLRVFLTNLSMNNEYSITIPFIESSEGDRLTDITLEFKAKDISFERLSKEHQQYILKKQDELPNTHTDPILKHLPHSTLEYELSPLVTQNDNREPILVLEARLLLTSADVKIDPQAATEQYKKSVVEYIKSLQLEPSNYTIRYIVISPTL